MNVSKLIDGAKQSPFRLWLLNMGLHRFIPFNKPHGFTITEIGDYHLKIKIPFRRSNLNHIRGLHACALATASEYATGLLIISKLGFETYRIILQRLEMDYHYQGKSDGIVEFAITSEWLEGLIIEPLKNKDAVVIVCEVRIHDSQGKHLTTGHVHWQIKKWSSVRTKVS